MSKKVSKKKTIRKGSRKLRNQKRIMGVLLVFTIAVGLVQVQALVNDSNKIDSATYSPLVFSEPLKQTLSVLQIAKKDGDSLFNNQNKLIEFSDIKNYDEDNLDRYLAYSEAFPELLTAEVVWRVNINLDVDDYTSVITIDNPEDNLAIINKNRAVASGYVPSDLTDLEDGTFQLSEAAAKAYKLLLADIKKAELDLKVLNAYMSEQEVKLEHDEYILDKELSTNDYGLVKPGHSEHQLGLAVDVENTDEANFSESEVYFWLKNNAHRFGFIFRYEVAPEISHYNNESNHLRYVGEDVAVDMYEKNIKHLEEYLDKYENR